METTINAMWRDYKRSGDRRVRNAIIMHYKPVLESVVSQMAHKYQDYYEFDDILGYGMIGLIDAIRKFDHTKGIKFQTYASIRIRGAIIDEVRRQDWIPRNVRQNHTAITDAEDKLNVELGRKPTVDEVSKRVEMPKEKIARVKKQWNTHTVLSLEEKQAVSDVEPMSEDMDIMPEKAMLKQEEVNTLAYHLSKLPEREQLVLTLSFYEELTLKEIGKIMDITESRVSQIRSKAIAKLRKQMHAYVGLVAKAK